MIFRFEEPGNATSSTDAKSYRGGAEPHRSFVSYAAHNISFLFSGVVSPDEATERHHTYLSSKFISPLINRRRHESCVQAGQVG